MDPRFLPHNTHLKGRKVFKELDPQLSLLHTQKYVFHSSLLKQLPNQLPGIYTLGGGRQIGKTTLLKQWIDDLLEQGVDPQCISFFSGELIEDYHSLLRLLQNQLESMPKGTNKFVIIDEVTYIQGWDKAIKYAADTGQLRETILMLTGSDLTFLKEAIMRFPGRRGKASVVNFHYYPLSFKEVLDLKKFHSFKDMNRLYQEFKNYLTHGGYLTAINDLALEGTILPATLATYSDWIRGDMLKRGKSEHYLREVIRGVIKCYNSQITWNTLAQELSIDHPHTIADYVILLQSMDALFIQPALLENKLTAAVKKAKKVVFCDPFIYHALKSWISPVEDPYRDQICPHLNDPKLSSRLVEGTVAAHYHRYYPTYYIKAEGEVDVAYIHKRRFWPVEVKWTSELKVKDLKQISKYPNGKILAKIDHSGVIGSVPAEPLPLGLLSIPETA